jgi:hypothetical protein
MSGVSKSYSELYSPARNYAPKLHLQWRFAIKIGVLQKLVKDATNFFFSDGIKIFYKTVEPVRWNRGVLLKSDISFVFIYLK